MRDNPDDYPDKTLTELQDEDHEEIENLREDIAGELSDRRKSITLIAATNVIARMFEDDVITLREYIRLTNWIEEENRSLEHGIL